MSIIENQIVESNLTKTETQPQAAVAVHRLPAWINSRLSLGAILLLSAILNVIALNPDYYTNEYYAAAVRSMLQNWHNFFYNSFDPGGFITIDKPPVALWLQTISAWFFGYNGISLLIPSILAGIGSVALLYFIIKPVFGSLAGLTAAFTLAITPIFVVMSRHNNPENILIFFMLLGAWAISRAASKGRLSWLILSLAMIGVAFNVKMLEAFVVLPTFYLIYFFLTPIKWWKRALHLLAASLVLAIVTFSWAVLVDLTPASQRPYIGSSGNNTVMNLIFNYNGLNRVEGQNFGGGNNNRTFPGNQGGQSRNNQNPPSNNGGNFQPGQNNNGSNNQPGNQNRGGQPGFGGGMGGVIAGQSGPLRMFDPTLAGEAGWLLPLALLGGLIAAVQTYWRTGSRRLRYQNLLLWGGWLITFMVVLSMAQGTIHDYYLVMLAPGVAALAGIGLESLWYAYRCGNWQKLLLPIVLLVTAAFQLNILNLYTNWNRALGLGIAFTVLICATAPLALPVQKFTGWIRGLAFLALNAAPVAWTLSAIFNKPFTNETLPTAAPAGATSNRTNLLNTLTASWNPWLTTLLVALVFLLIAVIITKYLRNQLYKASALVATALTAVLLTTMLLTCFPGPSATARAAQAANTGIIGNPQMMLNLPDQLIAYLQANQNSRTYLLATTSSQNAAPLIIKTGQPVMALGGFQGNDQVVNGQQFAQLVKNKIIRFVLLDNSGIGGGFNRGEQTATTWVQQNCQVVNRLNNSGQLYDCSPQG